jgi:nucleotide-binding universal stress UspA family protein
MRRPLQYAQELQPRPRESREIDAPRVGPIAALVALGASMSILLATDFSPEAAEAERVALAFARVLRTSIKVVHVLERGTTFPLGSAEKADNIEAERQKAAQELVDRIADRFESASIRTSTQVLRGDVVSALLEEVLITPKELVIVGACAIEGKASYRGLAEDIAETLPCPVLVSRAAIDGLCEGLGGKQRLRAYVAVDRTQSSDAAIEWLRNLRHHIACDLEVGYFFWPPQEYERLGVDSAGEPYAVNDALHAALEREVRQRFAEVAGTGNLTVQCRPYVDSVAPEVCSAAARIHAHLIVIGNHHRTRLGRFVHGSVSAGVLRYSSSPIVSVATGKNRDKRPRAIKHILVATDLSDLGNAAVAQAYELITNHRGTVTLLHVVAGPLDTVGERPHRVGSLELETLKESLRSLVPEYIDDTAIETRILIEDGGPVGARIQQVAEREGADLIMLGSNGRGAIDRALTGSVATYVVTHATRPVLVHRTMPR